MHAETVLLLVLAGVNAVAADTAEAARTALRATRRRLAVGLFGQGRDLSDDEADVLLSAGAGRHVDSMLTHTAAGTPDDVREQLTAFARLADADELIVAHQAPTAQARLRSVTLTAEAMDAVAA